jgi:hypothetical protein
MTGVLYQLIGSRSERHLRCKFRTGRPWNQRCSTRRIWCGAVRRAGAGDVGPVNRLNRLIGGKVQIIAPRIESGSVNLGTEASHGGGGMVTGADCIEDIDVLRSVGMKTLFDGVYAPSTVGTFVAGVHLRTDPAVGSVLREHAAVASAEIRLRHPQDGASLPARARSVRPGDDRDPAHRRRARRDRRRCVDRGVLSRRGR